MTVAETATALRVSPKTIRRMIARGELLTCASARSYERAQKT
jgi:excisionase family DNA binding protein